MSEALLDKEQYEKLVEERNRIKESITKERLLDLCKAMHTWIFLHSGDEQEVYDELGFTDEENFLFGYGGQIVLSKGDK